MTAPGARRRLLAPEVVQTSGMDCGPAALKCLLEGFGVPVSYGRLREACQTDVDGTSIDTLEDIAAQLGLDAEQIMLPVDTLLLPESEALPALVVVRLPNGFTHFVVLWRRHGPLVQVMDPASGRIWMTGARFLRDVYVHELRLPAASWHEWARSAGGLKPLARRLADLGIGRSARELIDAAARGDDWRDLAALDAATSLVASLVRAGGIRSGREAGNILRSFLERSKTSPPGAQSAIPEVYWSARPAPKEAAGDGEASGDEEILLRGAVLLRVRGPRDAAGDAEVDDAPKEAPALSPELAAALAEPPSRPGRELLRLLAGDGFIAFAVLGVGLALAAGSVFLEALILRGIFDLGRDLKLVTQRLEAAGYFLVFVLALLLIELRVAGALLRLGRRLETRLRLAFLEKIPRLMDRYFQSRPVSDMAERGHSTHQLRLLPRLGGQFVRATLGLVVTAAAIAWIYPGGALVAVLAALVAVALPLAFKPQFEEMDLRVRTHTGALSRFYLDALLGLGAVRAHGAELSVRREHESLLVEWTGASLRLVRTGVLLDGLQALTGFGFAAWLLFLYAGRAGEPTGALLLAYWALYLPVLGEEIAGLVRQYPTHRSLALRLLEPLGAPEERPSRSPDSSPPLDREDRTDDDRETPSIEGGGVAAERGGVAAERGGVAIALESVTVRAAGHTILEDVELSVDPGEHVAIVGVSGAGKSSLAGLLLGWHRASAGRVVVDGETLDAPRLDGLREETVWVDPAVQIWNRSLLANLCYGARDGNAGGEGGGLISGGEGQRVRLGRAFMRPRARLVILDEPFRGLDREKRRQLLERVRAVWRRATLLCITHDVSETRRFERVLVIDGGRIVEDGAPADLAGNPGSRYRALLDAEEAVRSDIWSNRIWRRLRLGAGRLTGDGRDGRNGGTGADAGRRS